MPIHFREAIKNDAATIAQLVYNLTEEINAITGTQHFDVDLFNITQTCQTLIQEGHYGAILGFADDKAIAVTTWTESYLLYTGGKIGIIPEFYVDPAFRSQGVGEQLIEQIRICGRKKAWTSFELCTPQLPEFERTLLFYEKNGLTAVGGRKMRQYL